MKKYNLHGTVLLRDVVVQHRYEDHGAVGNGFTDDTAAIQSFMDDHLYQQALEARVARLEEALEELADHIDMLHSALDGLDCAIAQGARAALAVEP